MFSRRCRKEKKSGLARWLTRHYVLELACVFVFGGFLAACGASSSSGPGAGGSGAQNSNSSGRTTSSSWNPPQGPKTSALSQNTSSARREVQEADIYRTRGNLLYYFHATRGLSIFQIDNPKAPKRLSSLPVFGYPVEMYVDADTAFLLVREPQQTVQKADSLQFTHSIPKAQLVAVDIRNPKQPKLLQRINVPLRLERGKSRRVGDLLYLVGQEPQSSPKDPQYSIATYDVSTPGQIRSLQHYNLPQPSKNFDPNVDNVPLLSGAGKEILSDDPAASPITRTRLTRTAFLGTVITATSTRLMVAENWLTQASYRTMLREVTTTTGGCQPDDVRIRERAHTFQVGLNYTIVNILDISDPNGRVRFVSRFKLQGAMTDQFKQTITKVNNNPSQLYLGIVRRNELEATAEKIKSSLRNLLLAVDLSQGNAPKLLHDLPFGKPDETVRASLYDASRKVVYAITATGEDQQPTPDQIDIDRQSNVTRERRVMRDPLYAISFANPKKLEVLSEIDGLSGDINLFRTIEKGNILVAVGRDTSANCSGFDKDNGYSKTAISLFDANDLKNLRLIQRKCIPIRPSVAVVSSQLNWDRDQAHKMIGLHAAGSKYLLSVPVSYEETTANQKTLRTAVGLMRWDMTRYIPNKANTAQQVLEDLPTISHPQGEVQRTFFLQLANDRPETPHIINISEEMLTVTSLQEPKKPSLQAQLVMAPHSLAAFRYGAYIVEQQQLPQSDADINNGTTKHRFVIKPMQKDHIDSVEAVHSFQQNNVIAALPWQHKLLVFFKTPSTDTNFLQVYDLSDPENPTASKEVVLAYQLQPGVSFGRCQFPAQTPWIATSHGVVLLAISKDGRTSNLVSINLNAQTPDTTELKAFTPPLTLNQQLGVRLTSFDKDSFIFSWPETTDQTTALQWNWSESKGWDSPKKLALPGHILHTSVKAGTRQYITTLGFAETFSQLALLAEESGQLKILQTLQHPATKLAHTFVQQDRLYLHTSTKTFLCYLIKEDTLERMYPSLPLHTKNITLAHIREKHALFHHQGGIVLVKLEDLQAPQGIFFASGLSWTSKTSSDGSLGRQYHPISSVILHQGRAYVAAGPLGLLQLDLDQTLPQMR